MLSSKRVDIPDDMEAIYDFICEKGWGDGLPIIPPTEERVQKMIDYIGRPPSEVIGELDPQCGKASIEKIAINAVMAGCLPEYMPVLIAAVEAMAEPEFNLHAIQTTTNPVAALAIINGPIREKLHVNCTRGCLGPGWRANAAIGRAIRFILINIGGGVPGSVDKAVHGMPGKYTFCFGEDEEGNPWEPLHVERGFANETSTITMIDAQATHNVVCVFPSGRTYLKLAANSMSTMGSNNMMNGQEESHPLVLLNSGHAGILIKEGFRKKLDVKQFLYENSGVPLSEYPPDALRGRSSMMHIVNGLVKPCKQAEDITIVVAGGPNPYHLVVMPTFGHERAITKPIPFAY